MANRGAYFGRVIVARKVGRKIRKTIRRKRYDFFHTKAACLKVSIFLASLVAVTFRIVVGSTEFI